MKKMRKMSGPLGGIFLTHTIDVTAKRFQEKYTNFFAITSLIWRTHTNSMQYLCEDGTNVVIAFFKVFNGSL